MEQYRISERNLIRNEINDKEKNIERNKATIKRISTIQEYKDFYKKQADKLEIQNKSDEEDIKILEQKIKDISLGKFDEEILKNINQNNEKMKKKDDSIQKKLKDKKDKNKEDKKNLDKEYQTFRRNDMVSAYAMEKETERFFRNADSLPDYMKANLKEMPNNKGYIWKGIRFYGLLPPESDTIILFEKCRNNILKIYEVTKDTVTLFEKVGKNQKKMISKTERKKLN